MKPKINEGKYIQSTFDDDFYKLCMQWAYLKKFPDSQCRFEYKIRSEVQWPEGFGAALQCLISQYDQLKPPPNAEKYLLKNAPFLPSGFIDYLLKFRFNPSEIQIFHDEKTNELRIKAEGPTASVMRWEIPVLATVSELFFEMSDQGDDKLNFQKVKDDAKRKSVNLSSHNIPFVDFGTRRRKSFKTHLEVVESFMRTVSSTFIGTSNVHIAMLKDIKCIGTKAHEWYQFHAGVYGYKMANFRAIENWQDVYQGSLGIVLPDTFTLDSFLPSFNSMYARLYDGIRWDSGCYKTFTEKVVNHYKKLGIPTESKTIVYSDGIDSIEKCHDIYNTAKKNNIKCSLGIGTWLTNDVGVKPLNQVMKMVAMKIDRHSEWNYTVKISDSQGKEIGDPNELKLAKLTLNISK